MEMGGIFFKNLKLYPPPTIRFGRVLIYLLKQTHLQTLIHLMMILSDFLDTPARRGYLMFFSFSS